MKTVGMMIIGGSSVRRQDDGSSRQQVIGLVDFDTTYLFDSYEQVVILHPASEDATRDFEA